MLFVLALGAGARAQAAPRIAVIGAEGAEIETAAVSDLLRASRDVSVLDRDLVASALRGAAYDGSVNLERSEAKRLALVTGSELLVFPRAYFRDLRGDPAPEVEVYVALFVADGRTGTLVRFRGASALASTRREAVATALGALRVEIEGIPSLARRLADERSKEPTAAPAAALDLVRSELPAGARPPRFFRKPAPAVTLDAERARVTATVDLIVHFGDDGRFGPIEVARWAGFGLDDAAVEAVRSREFVPAAIAGRPVSSRALLRYTFRVRD